MSDPARTPLRREDFAAYFACEARLHWTIAAGVAGRAAADDVLQDAAMIALAKLATFTPGTNLRAWFAQIVTNVGRNARRKERRRPETLVDGLAARAPTPAKPVDERGTLAPDQDVFDDRLVAALEELSGDARAAFLLRALHELPYTEIAATLEMPEGTAMSHVHRARAHLRERLDASAAALPHRREVAR